MGYTHYWYREKEIEGAVFSEIVKDFKKLLPLFKVLDIPLGNGHGEDIPVLDDKEVCFNGLRDCGHDENGHIALAWPSDGPKFGTAPNSEGSICGTWYAGIVLNQRTCGGDCSYETFYFPRVVEREHIIGKIAYRKSNGETVYNKPERVGRHFDCCKTNFRPYDLVVQVFLIISKHHLGDRIIVTSDGKMQHWIDAAKICQNAFGYGMDGFKLD